MILVAWNTDGRFTFIATAGQHNWRQESAAEQTRDIARVINHPSYDINVSSSPFDINVVQVVSAFVLNNLVRTIALPPAFYLHAGDVQAFGWGFNEVLMIPDVLQTTTLDILEYNFCLATLNAILGSSNPLHYTDMCTGPLTGSRGVCTADSGGPIVQNNQWTGNLELVGVVAWGASPCNRPNFPHVFTRVSAFNDFINQNVI